LPYLVLDKHAYNARKNLGFWNSFRSRYRASILFSLVVAFFTVSDTSVFLQQSLGGAVGVRGWLGLVGSFHSHMGV